MLCNTIQGLIEIMMKAVSAMAELEGRIEILEQSNKEYSGEKKCYGGIL